MPASLLAQMLIVSAAVLPPLVFIEALPAFHFRHPPLAAVRLAPPPPLGDFDAGPRRSGISLRRPASPRRPFTAPRRTPENVNTPWEEGPALPVWIGQGTADPRSLGSPDGILGAGSPAPRYTPRREEPVAPPKQPPKATPVRVHGQVRPPVLLREVKPIYPPLARSARVAGLVRLEGIIGRDGEIHSLRVVSGHPLLVEAALEAARQWRYQPTLLNGEPVEVILQIGVNFTLSAR